MVNLMDCMATRTMIFFVLFVVLIFIREHKKSERILYALLGVKLLPTLKHVFNINAIAKKSFTGLGIDARASFSPFSFFFSFSARLLMSFHGYSCLSIMIICIQTQI